MRVAIEAASLALSSGGLRRYTSQLSLALARNFPADNFYLTSDQPFPMPPSAPPNLHRGGAPRNAQERRWWLWGLSRELRRLHADLIHGPDFAVPYLNTQPSVLTLHDLSPWMDPTWHADAARVRRRTPWLLKMGIATIVITPSEHVRKQAIHRFHLRPDRVVAIPEAPTVGHALACPPARAAAQRYFLFVGALEPRKNIPALIEAWQEIRRGHSIDLILAGRRRADCPELPTHPGLHILGEVPDADLPALYSNAEAFVYPSHYEGFGLPVLEAMQCGACVIASTAVSEAAGDAAIYADTAAEIAQAMRVILEHPEKAHERRALSKAHAAHFTWDRTARATHEVYKEACQRFGR